MLRNCRKNIIQVDSNSYGNDRSLKLRGIWMVRESVIELLHSLQNYTGISFFCYHGSVRRS